MATDYRLDVYDTSGTKQFMITDFINLAYNTVVNAPGILNFEVAGDHSLLDSIADKWQIEVWRRPEGESWTREITGIFRDIDWRFTDKSQAELSCIGLKDMLRWRIINWATGTTNRSAFITDPAETIAKTLVDYNAGVNATIVNGRKRDGAISGLSVAADAAGGNTLTWYCHGKNLLEEIQDIALVGGGDFDLVKTSNTTYEFRWYSGQLGTDRTSSIVFSMDYGNMKRPVYKEYRTKEKTVACVWGQGEGSARDYVTRTGNNYSAGNNIEIYIDARDIDVGDTAGLNARGDKKLKDYESNTSFAFQTFETPATRYGVDYFLGDLITAVNPYNGTSYTLKISEVAISFGGIGDEKIEPMFSSIL